MSHEEDTATRKTPTSAKKIAVSTSNDSVQAVASKSSRYFSSLVGVALKYGFALLPARGGGIAQDMAEPFHDSVVENSTEDDFLVAEKACGKGVMNRSLRCFKFFTEDEGADWVLANVNKSFHGFFGSSVEATPVDEFAGLVIPKMRCSPEAAVMALVYLSRMVEYVKIPFTQRSAHRMLLGALVVAVKTYEENHFPLSWYGQQVGLTGAAFANIEMMTLEALQFATQVSTHEFITTMFSLRSCYAQTLGQKNLPWSLFASAVAIPEAAAYLPPSPPEGTRLSIIEHCRQSRARSSATSVGSEMFGGSSTTVGLSSCGSVHGSRRGTVVSVEGTD